MRPSDDSETPRTQHLTRSITWMATARCIAIAALALALVPQARAVIPGDANNDGTIDPSDATLVIRHVTGDSRLIGEAWDAANIAPLIGGLSTPDYEVNLGDLAVVQGLLGSAARPAAPDGLSTASAVWANPIQLDGTAPTGTRIHVFVEGTEVATGLTTAGGTFSIDVPLLVEGDNRIFRRRRGARDRAPLREVSRFHPELRRRIAALVR